MALIRYCLYVVVVAITLAIVLGFFGIHAWLLDTLSIFYWQYFVVLVPIFVFFLIMRKWPFAILSLVALLFLSWSLFSVYRAPEDTAQGASTLRIMWFNVFFSNTNYEGVSSYIKETNADLVFLTEINKVSFGEFQKRLPEYSVSSYERGPLASSMAVFSKLPPGDVELQTLTMLEESPVPIIQATVLRGQKQFVAYATHLMPPIPKYLAPLRNQELDELAQILINEKNPHLVAGDFNLVPWSPYYRAFLKNTGLRDSRNGYGLGLSWGAGRLRIFQLPIDHVFVSNEIQIKDRFIGPYLGSDHFPVIVDVAY